MPSGPRAGVQQSFLLRSCAGVDEGAVEAFPPVQWGTWDLRTVGVGLGQGLPSALCDGQLECDKRGLALKWKVGR